MGFWCYVVNVEYLNSSCPKSLNVWLNLFVYDLSIVGAGDAGGDSGAGGDVVVGCNAGITVIAGRM